MHPMTAQEVDDDAFETVGLCSMAHSELPASIDPDLHDDLADECGALRRRYDNAWCDGDRAGMRMVLEMGDELLRRLVALKAAPVTLLEGR